MLLTLAPFLIFDMPGITDYPNHLARMHLLTDGPEHPAAKFYDIVWFLTPNLGMDIVVPAMGQFLGVETATRIFLVVSMMLIMTGSAAIEVAVKKRISPVSLIAPIFAYNSAFLLGFLNFMFSFGLALWAIAFGSHCAIHVFWCAHFRTPSSCRYFSSAISTALQSIWVAVGAYEMWYLISRRPRLTDTRTSFTLLAGALLLAYVGMALDDDRPTHGGIMWDYPLKARLLATFAGGYGTGIASLKALAVMILVLWAWRRDALRAHPAAKWIVGALVAVFLAVPMASWDRSSRMSVSWWRLCSLSRPSSLGMRQAAPPENWRRLFYATVLLCNIANVTWAWAYLQQDYREIRQSFALLEPQRKILIGRPHVGQPLYVGSACFSPCAHACRGRPGSLRPAPLHLSRGPDHQATSGICPSRHHRRLAGRNRGTHDGRGRPPRLNNTDQFIGIPGPRTSTIFT